MHVLLNTCINMQKYWHTKTGVAQSAHVQYTVRRSGGGKSSRERPGSGLELAEILGTLRCSSSLSLVVV